MRGWMGRLAILCSAVAGCGGVSSAGRPNAGEQQMRPIVLTQLACYVVCDSLEARIHPTGIVVRREGGAVLGRERVRVPRRGADTIQADPGSLDSLRASLRVIAARRLDKGYEQGVPPCDSIVTSHTPIVTIAWGDSLGTHSLRYDVGCREPTGLLELAVRYAQQSALFRGIPVRDR